LDVALVLRHALILHRLIEESVEEGVNSFGVV
jgi:hypothetical protein